MMCGIDEAIRHIREDCSLLLWAERVINRLEYHRNQADGVKPRYHKGQNIKDYYTCGNCGNRVEIVQDFCWKCGYRIKWDSIRCLTGLPLVDAVARKKEENV